MANLTFLRALRLLRTLSSVSKLPALQTLVNAMLQSFGSLLDSFLLLGFFLFIFSMISIQLFGGLTRYRCFDAMSGSVINYEIAGTVYDSIDNGPVCSITTFEEALYLGVGRQCVQPSGKPAFCGDCGVSPDAGTSNWDNFLNAMLNNFVMTTGEGWAAEMYYVFILFVISILNCSLKMLFQLLVRIFIFLA